MEQPITSLVSSVSANEVAMTTRKRATIDDPPRQVRRDVKFYQIELFREEGSAVFDPAQLFEGHDNVAALKSENYFTLHTGKKPVVGLKDPSADGYTNLRFGAVKNVDLPKLLKDGNLANIDGELVSFSHVVFFGAGVLGMIRQNSDSPRYTALSEYLTLLLLQKFTHFKEGTDYIVISPLVLPDFFERLEKEVRDVTSARLVFRPSPRERMTNQQIAPSEVIGIDPGFAERVGAKTVTITLSAGRGKDAKLDKDEIASAGKRLLEDHELTQAEFKGPRGLKLRLTNDIIVGSTTLYTVEGTDDLEDSGAFAGIKSTHSRLQADIESAMALNTSTPFEEDNVQ